MGDDTGVKHLNVLPKELQSLVLELITRATDFDNTPPITEHILLHLRHGGDKSDSHLITTSDNLVTGYAHIDQTDLVAGPSVELVVDPAHRSLSIGKQLLSKALEICGQNLRLWVHGDLPAAHKLATSYNFKKIRTVLKMSRQLNELTPLPEIDKQIIIRSFLPGLDSNDWLTLNNKVFKDHPEQSGWKLSDLNHRLSEDWFDEKGFFIAELDKKMIASTWTKIHGGTSHDHGGPHHHRAIGEIYITAVDSGYARAGIGRALTITALNYLKYQGLDEAMLYVDEDNLSALRLYKSLGFIESGKDILFKLNA